MVLILYLQALWPTIRISYTVTFFDCYHDAIYFILMVVRLGFLSNRFLIEIIYI